MTDTIYALASPAGKGGIAVVRVSGNDSLTSLELLSGESGSAFAPRRVRLARLCNPVSRETIDEGMAVYFKAPASFTGEDVVEYYLHGGMAVVRSLLEALEAQKGHRMAEPGEFTRRAFENGKMDLTEAEAVADLIHAETSLQKDQALAQLGGSLSSLYEDWAQRLKSHLAHLEADIEFPDEDMPDGVSPDVMNALKVLENEIDAHLNDGRRGERLRDGIQIAVIGAPNAGKSSLVNTLAQRDVAIVSDMAGTTRDVIEVHLDIAGYPVILSDTAGLRPEQLGDSGHDIVEGEGIRRAMARAQAADLKILLFDGSELPQKDEHTMALADNRSLIVWNKADKNVSRESGDEEGIHISANLGDGITELLSAIKAKIDVIIGDRNAPSLTRERHRTALQECLSCLQRAEMAALPELVAEDVRLAMRCLGRITGKVHVEDLLDVIFSDFCIGK
ncbi:MAG: tRNA uridine-5-carboxymethylaminomethyl(34) synthesis GTPase MnmE [Pseudomonadota bacterium]|nr:tRNA uridine-5-carboxymethylaminomethyl(34) synthesis GTPase MnmE [Pseudomonadota bacterium]